MDKIYLKIEKILQSQGRFHISLELERIKKVLNKLSNPQEKLKVIHVGGTNGKGSVCKTLSEILMAQGCKVGLYTSPHLVKYNERISINNQSIDDERFLELIEKIIKIANEVDADLTEFEILTASMYQYFYEENVDIAVVEVGLGGRFDATNCITKPLLSIITSISFDHTDRLGDTIEKIAFEKSGIIKENCPVIFDTDNQGTKILQNIAKEKNAPIYYPQKCKIDFINSKNIVKYGDKTYEYNMLGKFQENNIALTFCAIEVLKNSGVNFDEKNIAAALKNVSWKGRFEYIKDKNIIIDGCHNPDGARVLKESLDFYFPDYKRTFIYTSLKNKDYNKVQQNLFRNDDKIYHFNTKSDRFITQNDIKNCTKSIDIKEVLELLKSKREKELLIICGSLYAIGDILGKI